MSDTTFLCPHCHKPVPITAALEHQAKELAAAQLAKEKRELTAQLEKAWQAKLQSSSQQLQVQLQNSKKELESAKVRQKEAEEAELAARKKAQAVAEKEQNLELEKQRAIDAATAQLQQQFAKQQNELTKLRDEEARRKLLEKDQTIDLMKKTIDDLRRQADQQSQQIQGESQERDLKEQLIEAFPQDRITDVPTGARGADLVQLINGSLGKPLGSIVWESKNTKSFSDGWLSKLKQDQGKVAADVAVLVSQVLPKEMGSFGQHKGVWLTLPEFALPLSSILRQQVMEYHRLQTSLEGQDLKMTSLYRYVGSSAFRSRIEQLVLAFIDLKSDLESERRAMVTRWNKREKQLEQLVVGTAGIYGDMQGIIGGALPRIPQLELESTASIEPGSLFDDTQE